MKTLFLALGLIASGALAQSRSEDLVYEQLTTTGPEAVSGLESVLKTPEVFSAVILYSAAGVAFREKRVEDAGFLFYVARIRSQFDKEMFPPVGTGGNSPLLLLGALQQQLGSVINPALMANPTAFEKALAKTKAWTPKVPATYDPGWEFTKKGNPKDAEAAIQDGRRKFIDGMTGLSRLLQDPKYFAAFRIAQDHNLKTGDDRPSKQAFEAAMQTMKQIEQEKGIQGIASSAQR
jgi:hypothetical protein